MRTDRGWRRFCATGWPVSAGITLAAFRLRQLHMRERVSSLVGLLQAGPRRDGGFRVRAELPLRASS